MDSRIAIKSKYRPLHLVQLLGLFVVLVGHEAAAYSTTGFAGRLTTTISSTSRASTTRLYNNDKNKKKSKPTLRTSRLNVAATSTMTTSSSAADFFPSLRSNDTPGFLVSNSDDPMLDLPVDFLTVAEQELIQEEAALVDATTTAATTTADAAVTTKLPPLSKIDIGTFGIHFCAAMTMTLPVMIVPMMDMEIAARSALMMGTGGVAAASTLAATMACMAPMGNGLGKLVNGVVCQQMGGAKSSRLYFMGSALASMALASVTLTATSGLLTPACLGYFVAGIEFCASIQWTVCSLFLSQYYKSSPALFARGITILSLSSTGGQIFSKLLGATLLQFVHWRQVARISVVAAILGLQLSLWTSRNMAKAKAKEEQDEQLQQQQQQQLAATRIVDSAPVMNTPTNQQQSTTKDTNIGKAVGRVLGSKVFWLIGLSHVSGYLTRTSDRILGTFLQEITSLSPQICGGLTAFMTVGFLYGLISTSRKFHKQPPPSKDSDDETPATTMMKHKLSLLRNGYTRYLISASGLIAAAAFGKSWHPYVSAGVITTCASIMASSIAFPFFQVPNMVSSIYFGEVKPVALSLIDGTGVFLTAPIWKIFTGMLLPSFGWTFSWSMIAMTVGLCGTLLMKTMPKVLQLQYEQDEALKAQAQP